jgi:hypothetical protein
MRQMPTIPHLVKQGHRPERLNLQTGKATLVATAAQSMPALPDMLYKPQDKVPLDRRAMAVYRCLECRQRSAHGFECQRPSRKRLAEQVHGHKPHPGRSGEISRDVNSPKAENHFQIIGLHWVYGGQRGIRTLETVPRLHTFQACAFDHSATCP